MQALDSPIVRGPLKETSLTSDFSVIAGGKKEKANTGSTRIMGSASAMEIPKKIAQRSISDSGGSNKEIFSFRPAHFIAKIPFKKSTTGSSKSSVAGGRNACPRL
tara:strand:- start:1530 stop:1844 length:315 start_codon:yes stop_codon:yes gene_type:complete